MRVLRRKRATTVVNPLAHLSHDELVAEHHKSGVNSHFLTEMTRRLMRSNERLSKWLLAFTVAIFLLTGVLVWTAILGIGDGHRRTMFAAPPGATAGSWLLWENHENRWKVRRALSDHATCVAALDDEVRTVTRMGANVSRDVPDSAVYSMKLSGSTGLNCFPDTVDPRGPKGK